MTEPEVMPELDEATFVMGDEEGFITAVIAVRDGYEQGRTNLSLILKSIDETGEVSLASQAKPEETVVLKDGEARAFRAAIAVAMQFFPPFPIAFEQDSIGELSA